MRLWTIQPLEFYNELIINGEIYCFKKYADSDFRESYDWIITEMEKKIGNRTNKTIYPIWSWY